MGGLTGLKFLPRELLSQILQLDIEYCALSLWKCGDKHLNYLLATGGVTVMTLRSGNSAVQNRWPSLLKNFRNLRILVVINTGTRLGDVNVVRRELMQLSSTLRTLKLEFKDAEEAILEESDTIPLLSRFLGVEAYSTNQVPADPMQHVTEKHLNNRRTWPLNDKFPNLEYLEIFSFDSSKSSFELVGLPDNLIGLKLHCCLQWTLTNTEMLPRSLQAIDLREICITGPEVLIHLPPCLTSLQNYIVWKDMNDCSLSQHLPQSLTDVGSFIRSHTPLSTIFLPPKLTTFTVPNAVPMSHEWLMAHLPQTLTKLTMTDVWYNAELASSLPNSLTELDLTPGNTRDAELSLFPPQLKILKLKRRITDLSVFAALPIFLKSLYLRNIDTDCLAKGLSMLPRDLSDFSFSYDLHIGLRSESNLPPAINLPPRLTSISQIRFVLSKDDPADMLAKLVMLLPRSLTELRTSFFYGPALSAKNQFEDLLQAAHKYGGAPKASGCLWPADAVAALPRNLCTLNITGSVHIAGFHYHLLPRSLTRFISQDKDRGTLPVLHHHLTQLPPSLIDYEALSFRESSEVFEFETSNEQNKTKTASLDLEDSKPFIITDHIVNHFIIPPGTNHYQIPEDWADALPKTLYSLFLPLPLNGTDCAQLPRSLRHLNAQAIYNVKSEHLRALPKRLVRITAPLFPAVSKSPYSSACRTEVLRASDLPPCLDSASLGDQSHIWLTYRNWAVNVRCLPPLPYAIAFPTNPSDPYHLHTKLQLD